MREVQLIAKALGDRTRLRALLALRDGELCLCHVIQLLDLSPATLSKHMDSLVQAGLVERRKEGRWCHFRLAGRQASPTARRALKWVLDALGDDPVIQADNKTLKGLRREHVLSKLRILRQELDACQTV